MFALPGTCEILTSNVLTDILSLLTEDYAHVALSSCNESGYLPNSLS